MEVPGAQSIPNEMLAAVRAIADAARMSMHKADAVVYLFCADRHDVISGGIFGNAPAGLRDPLYELCPRIELNGGSPSMTKTKNHPMAPKGGDSGSFHPGSIGARFYTGMSLDEIKEENPFAVRNWLGLLGEPDLTWFSTIEWIKTGKRDWLHFRCRGGKRHGDRHGIGSSRRLIDGVEHQDFLAATRRHRAPGKRADVRRAPRAHIF